MIHFVSKLTAAAELLQNLQTMQMRLQDNCIDIYKYIQSPEGTEMLRARLNTGDLLTQQENLSNQLFLIFSIAKLNISQQILFPDSVIYLNRLIFGLNIVLMDIAFITNSSARNSSHLYSHASQRLQHLIKENPDIIQIEQL
jgi:hypothetical protein